MQRLRSHLPAPCSGVKEASLRCLAAPLRDFPADPLDRVQARPRTHAAHAHAHHVHVHTHTHTPAPPLIHHVHHVEPRHTSLESAQAPNFFTSRRFIRRGVAGGIEPLVAALQRQQPTISGLRDNGLVTLRLVYCGTEILAISGYAPRDPGGGV